MYTSIEIILVGSEENNGINIKKEYGVEMNHLNFTKRKPIYLNAKEKNKTCYH